MKNFTRLDLSLSLCGLNCMLCSMHISGYCPGCGGGEGNQSCKIAKCSMEHGRPEYCNECKEYPCETYEGFGEETENRQSGLSGRAERKGGYPAASFGKL